MTDDERIEFKRAELRRAQELSGEMAGMSDPDSLAALLDTDDFRDEHERAFRAHVLGAVDLHVEHRCDDLCSAAIIDRLLGKHPGNEYPWQLSERAVSEGNRTASHWGPVPGTDVAIRPRVGRGHRRRVRPALRGNT